MNYNKKTESPLRAIPVLLIAAAVVVAIVYFKQAVNTGRSAAPGNDETELVRPDTTAADTSLIPASVDTVPRNTLPDTLLGRDKRNPYEAGYEDGYAAGCEDGAAGQPRANYDETCTFARSEERVHYAEGYREGYGKGLQDGANGTQFGIGETK